MPSDTVPDATVPYDTAASDPFASLPAAVTDGGPPLHYGGPLAEQRALLERDAIVDLADRGVVAVAGPDRLTWLDSLTSQRLAGLAPGESAETLLLDPSGRVEHAARVVDDGGTAWLLVDPGATEGLAAFLERMRFRLDVTVADRSAEFATLGTLGAPALPAGLVVAEWRDPWTEVVAGGWQYASADPHPGTAWTYRELLVPRARLGEAADAVRTGALAAAGTLALEALRIAAWRPREATEVDATAIPHETDWLRSAVHLAKGCYRGQETVAKVHNLGHPPRRLVLLHLDGSDSLPIDSGDEVRLGDETVGRVTSVGVHHELGPIALALVRRATLPDADLVVVGRDGAVAAAQETIVPADAGSVAGVPRLPRLTRR